MSLSTKTRNGNGRIAELEMTTPEVPAAKKPQPVVISAPKMMTINLNIEGTAPYLQCRFPQKAMIQMMSKQAAGDQNAKRAKRTARDFDADFQGSMHRISDKVYGIPAAAFRAAAISACRLVNFKMTIAKLSIFIESDGYDMVDSTPLVIINGKPEKHTMIGRNDNGGADIRVRAIYKEWTAKVSVTFDTEQFSPTDVVNLFTRIGQQIGVGEGRPDSKNSAGMGLGTFKIVHGESTVQ